MAEREAREWMRFAEDDLEVAKYLVGMPKRKLEIICYHSQQCAEKAIKGVYAWLDRDVPRTHDFRVLAAGIMPQLDFTDYQEMLALLQPFAIIVRYPYEIELLPGDDEKAIAAAEAILGFCRAGAANAYVR
jgi:HEPN domain-containing protein